MLEVPEDFCKQAESSERTDVAARSHNHAVKGSHFVDHIRIVVRCVTSKVRVLDPHSESFTTHTRERTHPLRSTCAGLRKPGASHLTIKRSYVSGVTGWYCRCAQGKATRLCAYGLHSGAVFVAEAVAEAAPGYRQRRNVCWSEDKHYVYPAQ
jgi:hypothetical protein